MAMAGENDELDNATRQALHDKLLEMQKVLLENRQTGQDAAKVVALDQASVGRLSRIDAMQQQAMAQAENQRRDGLLKRIDSALERIHQGDYGLCLTCDEPIAAARLQFDPSASDCIGCASSKERKR